MSGTEYKEKVLEKERNIPRDFLTIRTSVVKRREE